MWKDVPELGTELVFAGAGSPVLSFPHSIARVHGAFSSFPLELCCSGSAVELKEVF